MAVLEGTRQAADRRCAEQQDIVPALRRQERHEEHQHGDLEVVGLGHSRPRGPYPRDQCQQPEPADDRERCGRRAGSDPFRPHGRQ